MKTGVLFEGGGGYMCGLQVADALWIKPWPINHADAPVGRVVAQRQHCCFSPDQQKSGDARKVPLQVWQGGLIIVEIKRKILQSLQEFFQHWISSWCRLPTWILHHMCVFWNFSQTECFWSLRIHISAVATFKFLTLCKNSEICSFPQGGEKKRKVTLNKDISDLKRKCRTPGMSSRGRLPHPHTDFFVTLSLSVATATSRRPPSKALQPTLKSSSSLVASSSYKKKFLW